MLKSREGARGVQPKTLTLTHPNLPRTDHVTSKKQFFAYNSSGLHFYPTSCGVIRNQRRKIRQIPSSKYATRISRLLLFPLGTGV